MKSESIIYKAKRERRLLNDIEEAKKSNRELIVKNKILEESNKALAYENKLLKYREKKVFIEK